MTPHLLDLTEIVGHVVSCNRLDESKEGIKNTFDEVAGVVEVMEEAAWSISAQHRYPFEDRAGLQ